MKLTRRKLFAAVAIAPAASLAAKPLTREDRKALTIPSERQYQLRVQLAGCSVAALGARYTPVRRGDYGWSPAYQDVLNLRQKFDRMTDLGQLHEAVARGWCHSKNSSKEMDVDLAEAIVDELDKLAKKP